VEEVSAWITMLSIAEALYRRYSGWNPTGFLTCADSFSGEEGIFEIFLEFVVH
jgi:hypothetical protein